VETPRDAAMRGACHRAASGERCGSSPEPDAVSSSAGIRPSAAGFSRDNASASFATRSKSFFEVGPKLDPDEDVASKPLSPPGERRGFKPFAPRRRWTRLEILRRGEWLRQHPRADNPPAVGPHQAAVGWAGEEDLSDRGDDEWIQQSGEDECDRGSAQRDE